jgi:branched-chain amino acid transport system permease protein
MGFAALGGLSAVLIAYPPVPETIKLGGKGVLLAFIILIVGAWLITFIYKSNQTKRFKKIIIPLIILILLVLFNFIGSPAIKKIEAFEPAATGFLGGLGLPILFSWIVGGVFAGIVAYFIGKLTLGLRSDYLAIATLGIAEVIIYFLKNENWLTRGVKNVNGLPRPVPYEVDLQGNKWFIEFCETYNFPLVETSSIVVKISYCLLFSGVLITLFVLSEIALKSPWGRMMRAIRDNEVSAKAMGKNVKARHLEIFIIGSAVVGLAGAMLTTLEGQFTPTTYQPLRFTFTVWVMVIIGGTGNNYGSLIGGFLVWFLWVEAEPLGLYLVELATSPLNESNPVRVQLINNAAHMRYIMMGLLLLLVLRFAPKGIFPEGR